METFSEKTRRALDWLQHGYLLVQIAGSLGIGTMVRALLSKYTAIDPIWITPIWLLSATIVLVLLVLLGTKLRLSAGIVTPGQQQQQAGSVTQQYESVD